MWNNLQQSYQRAGRTICVPSARGREVGRHLRALLTDHHFPPFYRHLGGSSSIDVLHAHRRSAWFATADISRFYPSIGRSRVAHALLAAGIEQHRHFAKWSTVRAPGGGYVLPAGFPQSTILATMVLQQSALGRFLDAAARAVTVQVYLDDISLSADDRELLADVYAALQQAAGESDFAFNQRKSQDPARRVELFGCELEQGRVAVTEARRAAFDAEGRGAWSAMWFERYCEAVEWGNVRACYGVRTHAPLPL